MKKKTVIITGASKGIGRQLALNLATLGSNVVVVARSENELDSLKTEIEKLGAKCLVFSGSVASEEFVNKTVVETISTFGTVDFMINNAGFGIFGRVETITAEQWTDTYETNVKGTFLFSKAVLPIMKKNQKGHIINIASDVAKRVFDGGSLYCSSKFAQDAFSAAIRKEVRNDGIKVSVVYSGLVDTNFHPNPGSTEKQVWLTASDMANTIQYIMEQPAHVVIDELMIHPLSQEY